ncbi:PepSY domain-containing protein [Ornithinimicrobium sp. F0845]|uniref:PepSY domain-containing protein n=1 Tax=Ornithinimicrobium sp. F0845 TaxID=2926412 RepID=UPI001FF144A1|nr:PepSY domain-containing protein [Ornithinimicrobium sp. F0845]MCK0111512.1 PepSY domain-containing protein [Ornithinimicrobium sp. F0845]
MRNSQRLTMTTALALTMTLGLVACGESEPDTETPGDAPSASAPAETGAEDTTTDDAAGDTSADDASGATDDAADATGGTTGDLTATGLAAIDTAEAETGGTAYEIDDLDDDGTWEVDVRVDDHSVEVKVSADGAEVLQTEQDDLDDDDRAALEAATITLQDAIELAVSEVGGVLDDAELEGEGNGNPHHWEVSVDTDERDDIEVLISVTGEVLGTDG